MRAGKKLHRSIATTVYMIQGETRHDIRRRRVV